ncbi:hypothetical protein H0H93_016211 [Arthromyces matolae]|nr:hypothetical protein H0H93_016211 [Arthromyces matolae]
MSYVNMIYLGTISERIPIVPPFFPDEHIAASAGPLPFGEIFDLKGLRQSLRKPVLEWLDVKALPERLSVEAPSSIEQIGCWSIRPPNEKNPIQAYNLLHHLGLDVSYTRLPAHIRQDPNLAANAHIALMPLAEKIYPFSPLTHAGDEILMAESPNGAKLSPENHLSCFDFMYFASVGTQPYEWKSPWAPAWRLIGQHLRFTDSILALGKGYVRRALQVTSAEIPPFITVHARRGDFVHQCWDVPTACLAPISAYARRVKEIQGSLFVKSGIEVTEVIITSDEKDPAFWEEVRQEGWKYIDHTAEKTQEKYGEWYVPLVDIVVQSMGAGFVGSIDSTVSISLHWTFMTPTTDDQIYARSPLLAILLQPRKAKLKSVLVALTTLVCLGIYILLIRPSFSSSQPLLDQDTIPNQLAIALESTRNSRVSGSVRKHEKLSRLGEQVVLDQRQELAAVSSFLASLPQNVIPSTVDPSVSLDPQLILDFDTRSAHAAEEVQRMVVDVWQRNPVFLYSKLYAHSSREVKAILSKMSLRPSPTIIDVDIRDDAKVLEPILYRLTSSLELPILLVGGAPVGSIDEIRALESSGQLRQMITAAGAVIDGSKKARKH